MQSEYERNSSVTVLLNLLESKAIVSPDLLADFATFTEKRIAYHTSQDLIKNFPYKPKKLPRCYRCEKAIRDREYTVETDGRTRHLNACPLNYFTL